MFEMTASFLMHNEGKDQTFLKVPFFLKDAFGNGKGYLGKETGSKIIDWINTGEKEDNDVVKCKSELLMATELGIAGLTALWNTLSKPMQAKMKHHFSVYKSAALAYDQQAIDSQESPQDQLKRNQEGKQPLSNLP